MKSVKVSISFPKASELQNQLDKVISKMNNSLKIDLDTKNFNKSLNDMSKLISKLKSQLADFNILEKLDGDGTSVAKTAKEVNNLAEAMGKLNEKSQLRRKKDEETWALKDIQAYNKAMDDSYKSQVKLEESLEKTRTSLQNKLNTASSNSFVDTSVIDKLQTKLNSINTNTPEKEFNELKSAINNLSSADSGIVRIQNAVIRLQERIAQIKKNNLDVVDTTEIAELRQAETELSKLQSMLSQLKTGELIDGKAISNQINIANNSVRSLENQFKSVNNTASGLVTTMKNIFSYAIGGSAFYTVMNSMRDAIETTVELDDAMRDLRRVTELTNSEYSEFTKTANQTAIALGTTTAGAIEATTRFSQLGYSFSEASDELSKYALILSNVADMNAKDASSSIVSVLKGFQMETDEVSKIVDVINEAGNKFAIDSSGLADALKVGAANLSLAGNDLEQASALIITANEVMQDPTTVSNGLRTIGMRLRGVSEDGEELSATMNELIKSMTGVSVEGLDGELRSTYDILKDIGEVWDTLNTKQQELLSSEIAGKNRANVFASLMQNAEQLEKAYDTLKDSVGSAEKEQETYMDSLSGRINALKESFTAITIQMVDSDFLKGFISSMTTGVNAVSGFIDIFGTIPTTVTAVVGALTIFNNKFRESTNSMLLAVPGYGELTTMMSGYEKSLKTNIASIQEQIINLKKQQVESLATGNAVNTLGIKMVGLNGKLALTTAGLIATKVATLALQTALNMGIGLAISGVITVIGSFVSGLGNAEERIQAVDEKSKALADTLNNFKETNIDLNSYEKLSKKLEQTNLSEEERKDLNNQLLEVKEQLYAIDDSAYSILNNQNLSYQEQLDLLKQINEQKLYDTAKELDKQLKNGIWKDESKNAEDAKITLEQNIKIYKEIIELQKQANGGTIEHADLGVLNTDQQTQLLEQLKSQIEDSNLTIQRYNSNVELMEKANYNTDRTTIELSDSTRNFVNELNSSTDAIEENTKAKQENANVDIGSSSVDTTSLEDSMKAYKEAISKTKELQAMVDELNEEQSLSPDLVLKLADSYPELGARITSVTDVQEFLNEKISEQVEVQANAYNQMVANDNAYYTSKIQNNDAIQENFNALLSAFVTNGGESYQTDLKNYKNLSELKADLTNQFGETIANLITNFVTAQSRGYNIDLDNTISWAKSKSQILQQLNRNITKIESRLTETANKINNIDITDDNMTDLMKQYRVNAQKLAQLKTQEAEIQTEFSKYTAGFQSYSPTFSGTDFKSGTGSSSGKNSTEKEVDNLKSLVNRYLQVESALDKVNNAIKENQILMENSSDEERLKNLDKEIKLLQEKKVALQNVKKERQEELQELKNSLSKSGFTFGSDGIIKNYEQRLEALRYWANSKSGDAKESEKDNVENIADNIDRYMQLLLKDIPEVNNEILDLKNTTIDTQKEIAEILEKQKDNYISNLEKETDALKKEIQKRKVICLVHSEMSVGHNFNCR